MRGHADTLNVYWGNSALGTIGSATLDGVGVNQSLISGGTGTCGVSLGQQLAWANTDNSTIGVGTTDGTLSTQNWAFAPAVAAARGTATYFNGFTDQIYWVNADGSIWETFGEAQSPRQILPPNTVDGQAGIAASADGLFWVDPGAGTIEHSDLEGSGVSTLVSGIFGSQCGIAVDDTYVYWTDDNEGTIGRALLNGSSPDPSFIELGEEDVPCWLAVDPDIPSASVSPSSLGFGGVLVDGTAPPQDVVLTNSSSTTVDLILDDAQLAGLDPGEFSITANSCAGVPILPGDSCTISVDFSPSSLGGKAADLFIQTDDPTGTLIVPLSGTGTDPDESVVPSSITFGHQLVDTAGPVWSVVLTNEAGASAPDDIGLASLAGPDADQFEIVTDDCSNMSVAIGASCEVSLQFAPTAEGPAAASLSIPSDDPSSPATVALSGTGTAPDQVISPSAIAFDSHQVGTDSATQTIDVNNSASGTGPLTIGTVSLAGSNPSQFDVVSDNCSSQSISPGDDCQVGVRFAPSAAGAQSAAVQIPSNGSPSPVAVTVTGTGVPVPAPTVQNPQCKKLRAKLKKAKSKNKSKKQRKAIRKKLRKLGC